MCLPTYSERTGGYSSAPQSGGKGQTEGGVCGLHKQTSKERKKEQNAGSFLFTSTLFTFNATAAAAAAALPSQPPPPPPTLLPLPCMSSSVSGRASEAQPPCRSTAMHSTSSSPRSPPPVPSRIGAATHTAATPLAALPRNIYYMEIADRHCH